MTSIYLEARAMPSQSSELLKLMTDVLDEVILTMPVDSETPARVTRIGNRILKAAVERRTSYAALIEVASAEADVILRDSPNWPSVMRQTEPGEFPPKRVG
jgi:hypothetical protein